MKWSLRMAAAVAAAILAAGCGSDMKDGSRLKPFEKSGFFQDRMSARPLVEGTVAHDAPASDDPFVTGVSGGRPVADPPVPVTRELLSRGRERFDIYCAVCHSRTGDGDGMVVRRGFKHPPSFHEQRLRDAPAGHFFTVITHGFGVMQDYAAQVPASDRWAIVAYIRALQYSRNAPLGELEPEDRMKLEKTS